MKILFIIIMFFSFLSCSGGGSEESSPKQSLFYNQTFISTFSKRYLSDGTLSSSSISVSGIMEINFSLVSNLFQVIYKNYSELDADSFSLIPLFGVCNGYYSGTFETLEIKNDNFNQKPEAFFIIKLNNSSSGDNCFPFDNEQIEIYSIPNNQGIYFRTKNKELTMIKKTENYVCGSELSSLLSKSSYQGCCSFHGGIKVVNSCYSFNFDNKLMCNDNSFSLSCSR